MPSSVARAARLPAFGLLALAAAGAGRLGLLCFTPSVPERLAGCSAGRGASAALREKLGRVTLHEAMDYQSARIVAVSPQEASPKRRLLRALLAGGEVGGAAHVAQLVAELQAEGRGTDDATSVFDGTWHILSSTLSDSRIPAPQLAIYKGGDFLHEGSIQNAGLFKAILQREAGQAPLKLGVPRATLSEGQMEVSAQVEVAPGREKTLSYSAQVKFLSPTTFRRHLMSLGLPEPAGSLKPLIETHDIIEVTYSDDDLLVFRDEAGHLEILARDSAEALVPRSGSEEVMGVSEMLVESPALAMSG